MGSPTGQNLNTPPPIVLAYMKHPQRPYKEKSGNVRELILKKSAYISYECQHTISQHRELAGAVPPSTDFVLLGV